MSVRKGRGRVSRGVAEARSGKPWPRVKLGDVCESISDGDHLAPPKCESGVPFVTISDISNNQFDLSHVSRFVPESYYAKLDGKRKIRKGDVLYSVVGSYGIPVYADSDLRIAFQRHIAILRAGASINSRFMYYVMLGHDFYMRAENVAVGAAQKTISLTSLRGLEIPLPPLPLQRRIADILSAYDDKIANNRRRMGLLEESARLVYRKMFGSFAWPMRKLKDVANVNESSYTPKTLPQEIDYIDIASVSRGEIKTKTHYEACVAPGRARRIAKDGDIIWSNVRPNLKAYSLVLSPGLNDVFSTGFSVVTAKKVPFTHLYFVLSDDAFVSYLDGRVTGATYPAVKPSDFEEYRLPVPDDALLKQFHSIVLIMFRQREMLSRQNAKLASARDMLLPQLLSGKTEVS